jgi:hypothetical protein
MVMEKKQQYSQDFLGGGVTKKASHLFAYPI